MEQKEKERMQKLEREHISSRENPQSKNASKLSNNTKRKPETSTQSASKEVTSRIEPIQGTNVQMAIQEYSDSFDDQSENQPD